MITFFLVIDDLNDEYLHSDNISFSKTNKRSYPDESNVTGRSRCPVKRRKSQSEWKFMNKSLTIQQSFWIKFLNESNDLRAGWTDALETIIYTLVRMA